VDRISLAISRARYHVSVFAEGPNGRIQSGSPGAQTAAGANFKHVSRYRVCKLFSNDLRYDFRGHPERSYTDICTLLRRSLEDKAKKFTYAVQIKDILIGGELAVVRLTWTLDQAGGIVGGNDRARHGHIP
jgi:hypothetical protein